MRASTLTKIVFFFTILISLIMVIQLFWLNKLYSYEQRLFNTNVVKVSRGVLEDLPLTTEPQKPLQELISTPDLNNFLIWVDSIPPKDSLVSYLTMEMEDFDLFTDCKLAVYDHTQEKYVYEVYLPTAASHHPENSGAELGMYKKDYDYVHLFFPHRNKYILHEMRFWISGSVLLLFLLIALGASVFYLYKQKFLNEIQNDFIRNITHEFQTPLTTMKVALDLISKPAVVQNAEKMDKYTSLMKNQADYLQQHVENLVKVIKTDNGGLTLQKEKLNPEPLIQSAIQQLQFQLDEKNSSVDLKFSGGNMLIEADRNNLYIVFLNLISNAIKYAPRPHIIIKTKVENRHFDISINDNGIGIEKKFLKKLFRKFYRIPTGDLHSTKGLGLGLYFVHKIIEAHNGKIFVNSRLGIGTEFKIILPVA